MAEILAQREHEGRLAVITGGARGFGKAFGHALAARGAHVVLVDLDAAAAEAAAAGIRGAGANATAFGCDISDEAQVADLAATIAADHGHADILINNAGLHSAAYSGPMHAMGLAKVRRLFEVNLMGTILCSLAFRPLLERRENATIVNLSSTASYPPITAYGVSKLAVSGLTMAFARELAEFGIRVNAIAPGLIFTDTIRAELPEAMVKAVMQQQILPREGAESDVVEAMLYLVSPRAPFVTGETLRVSGGFGLSV